MYNNIICIDCGSDGNCVCVSNIKFFDNLLRLPNNFRICSHRQVIRYTWKWWQNLNKSTVVTWIVHSILFFSRAHSTPFSRLVCGVLLPRLGWIYKCELSKSNKLIWNWIGNVEVSSACFSAYLCLSLLFRGKWIKNSNTAASLCVFDASVSVFFAYCIFINKCEQTLKTLVINSCSHARRTHRQISKTIIKCRQ